jgi:UDP-2,3-diacylglucosamine pyrophosphatase LpxH
MIFAAIADVHLGAFASYPKLAKLQRKVFRAALQEVANQECDAVVILGDLFHSPPNFQTLYWLSKVLMDSVERGSHVHAIVGSHDGVAGQRSALDVLHAVGGLSLLPDGQEFLLGGYSTWVLSGRRGGLEAETFAPPKNFKGWLLYHTALEEALPESLRGRVPSISIKDWPKDMTLGLGGHLHWPYDIKYKGRRALSPGPLLGSSITDLLRWQEGYKPQMLLVDREERVTKADIPGHWDKELRVVRCKVTGLSRKRVAQRLKMVSSKTLVLVVEFIGDWAEESPIMAGWVRELGFEGDVLVAWHATMPKAKRAPAPAPGNVEVEAALSKLATEDVTKPQAQSVFTALTVPVEVEESKPVYQAARVKAGCRALEINDATDSSSRD